MIYFAAIDSEGRILSWGFTDAQAFATMRPREGERIVEIAPDAGIGPGWIYDPATGRTSPPPGPTVH